MHQHVHPEGDRPLLIAVAANVLLTIAEVVGGILSGSLSLVADALHNLSDAGALFVAFMARRIARRPADEVNTFGYRRAEAVGTLINVTVLIVIGLYLLFEAVTRYFAPEPVAGWVMIGVSGVALAVDLLTAALTYTMAKRSLNVRAAFTHNVADALGSLAVIAAGTLIILHELYIADVIATLLIAGYVLFQGIKMLRQAIRALMDAVPEHIDIHEVAAALRYVDRVAGVHHLHVWLLGERYPALEAHVTVRDDVDITALEAMKLDIKDVLRKRFGIEHSTIEFELHGTEGEAVCPEDLIPEH